MRQWSLRNIKLVKSVQYGIIVRMKTFYISAKILIEETIEAEDKDQAEREFVERFGIPDAIDIEEIDGEE